MRRAAALMAGIALLAAVASLAWHPADAAFVATTANSGSSWASGSFGSTLKASGDNTYGQLGTGDKVTLSAFTGVSGGGSWLTAATGKAYSCGVQTSGALYCWGYNFYGQLGLGDTTQRLTPTQVGSVTTWSIVAAGEATTCAIRTDQSLWCWGTNGFGSVGDGTTTERDAPVHIGSASWKSIDLGSDLTCGVQTGGTLWCWGYNGAGELGIGNTNTPQKSPVQVGSATTWSQVSTGYAFGCAVRTNGTLWCWGVNADGEVGDGTTTNRTSPVQVGTATDWSSVTAGYSSACALKTTGTVWCWGFNQYGEVADGTTTTPVKSPKQVGSGTSWTSVVNVGDAYCAQRNDNTLWCWGYNGTGQLGLGDQTNRTSPVQISSPASVQLIAKGSQGVHTLLLQ
jgi:alpha-tubulin suppressor-like RCC1 family protein